MTCWPYVLLAFRWHFTKFILQCLVSLCPNCKGENKQAYNAVNRRSAIIFVLCIDMWWQNDPCMFDIEHLLNTCQNEELVLTWHITMIYERNKWKENQKLEKTNLYLKQWLCRDMAKVWVWNYFFLLSKCICC